MVGSIARADVDQGLRGCIGSANQQLSKTRTNGTSDTTVSIVCQGNWARYLFDSVGPYGSQSAPKYDDVHELRIIRYFGNLGVASQCIHTIQDPYGRGVDMYTCFLSIDLNSAVTKAM